MGRCGGKHPIALAPAASTDRSGPERRSISLGTPRHVSRLAPQTAKALGHFMYPHGETAGKGTLNRYDPASFRYKMVSKEVTA